MSDSNDIAFRELAYAIKDQQAKIDALESQLSIAVDALEEISRDSFVDSWQAKLAELTLTKINALKKG
jgi:hypothetical protein